MEARKFTKEIFYLHEKKGWRELLILCSLELQRERGEKEDKWPCLVYLARDEW
jgi:hypothetical protein